jgi:hypothetical protein
MPTVLILLGGILIMIFVIPYAFSSVIQQLKNVSELDRIQEMKREAARNASLQAALEAEIKANASASTPKDLESIPEPSRLFSNSETSPPFSEGLNT